MTVPPTSSQETGRADSIEFIGNATVLIRHSGFTILTDPNFVHRGEEVPLGLGLTTTRLTDPATEIGDLPPLDLVVLSHYHGDHFDQVAEERLDRSLSIVTTPQAADILGQKGFYNARSLETWESHQVSRNGGSLRVTSLPGQHAPGAVTIALPDVMGSLLEFSATGGPGVGFDGQPDLRLHITGDTIMFEGLREIPDRYPEIDVALVHLGGTRVLGLTVTMDAEQGVEWLRTVQPALAIPIHYDDYEAFKSPLENFTLAVEAAGLGDRVRYLRRGEVFDLRPVAGARSS
ncbi:MAG TPA: MBL fold metallo-hydrolase [Candidatus Limnocylindrales bacterium]|nr:MBL fold metallo-hydrolase [Candidatus Limnocylindrales bacterium]